MEHLYLLEEHFPVNTKHIYNIVLSLNYKFKRDVLITNLLNFELLEYIYRIHLGLARESCNSKLLQIFTIARSYNQAIFLRKARYSRRRRRSDVCDVGSSGPCGGRWTKPTRDVESMLYQPFER